MHINRHELQEALIQAPGEQVLELGKEIDAFQKAIAARADVSSALRDEIDERLAYFVARTREIEPVVEKLQEVLDLTDAASWGQDDDPTGPTDFMVRQQPPFAALLLQRLACARANGNAAMAAALRDAIATYARASPIEGVRDALIDGLRRDAYEHGETKPGYRIARPADARRQLCP